MRKSPPFRVTLSAAVFTLSLIVPPSLPAAEPSSQPASQIATSRPASAPTTGPGRYRRGPRGPMSPSSAQVEAAVKALAQEHPDCVKLTDVIRTVQGRPIYAVAITDPRTADENKQNVVIIAGQHGNEESGRMVALALLDWLVSPEAGETRAKQKIVVMPNVNPDGAELDRHETTEGVQPNLDHGPGGAKTPEGKATEIVLNELQPEVFVDIHAAGLTGCGHDLVLYARTAAYNEDDNILHAMAADMAKAGEETGLPHMTHSLTWPGWGGNDPDEPSTTQFAYRRFKSIVFLTETAESNRESNPEELRKKCGVARMKAMLAYGNRRDPRYYYEGYPSTLMGMDDCSLTAVGQTAQQRRQSRVALWANLRHLDDPRIALPQAQKQKTIHFSYDGQPFKQGLGIQVRAPLKMDVQSVALNGRELKPSTTDGYYTWQDVCSTFVVVAFPELAKGDYEIQIQFK